MEDWTFSGERPERKFEDTFSRKVRSSRDELLKNSNHEKGEEYTYFNFVYTTDILSPVSEFDFSMINVDWHSRKGSYHRLSATLIRFVMERLH